MRYRQTERQKERDGQTETERETKRGGHIERRERG